ncbi:MAG: hypothetical protein ACHQUC_07130 [Chlamydiales bacterium]
MNDFKTRWMLSLLCFLIVSVKGFSKPLPYEVGTIIVTYQTDQEGQRLDRIRFWLINANHERTLYPKKDEFVANTHPCLERTVVIARLPIGPYRIQFLIPNADQIFEEVAPREIELTADAVIKIDQLIRLRPVANDPPKQNPEIGPNELNPPPSPMLPTVSIAETPAQEALLENQSVIIPKGRRSILNLFKHWGGT